MQVSDYEQKYDHWIKQINVAMRKRSRQGICYYFIFIIFFIFYTRKITTIEQAPVKTLLGSPIFYPFNICPGLAYIS